MAKARKLVLVRETLLACRPCRLVTVRLSGRSSMFLPVDVNAPTPAALSGAVTVI